jgi:hypothetical protein
MAISATQRPTAGRHPDGVGLVAGRRCLRLLWWILAGPIVGFVVAEAFLSRSWPLWQVLPLAVLLAGPFAAGAMYGLQAARHGDRRGWALMSVHLAFAVLAVVMPVSESLSS